MNSVPVVLILTAGFGEGHNSAARGLQEAIRERSGGGVEVVTADLFEDAAPITGGIYKWLYCWMINWLPSLWKWLFRITQVQEFSRLGWDRFVGIGPALEKRLEELRPQIVISTYPVYPYFMPLLAPKVHRPEWFFLVITDSITIHPIWWKGKVDRLFVTDSFSKTVVEGHTSRTVSVEVSGFPVSMAFRRPGPEAAAGEVRADAGEGIRPTLHVLYFATTRTRHVGATLRGLMEDLPEGTELTVAAGKHIRRLNPLVEGLRQEFPKRKVQLIGWTREVPRLLREHDLVITKAGGATVHECFAAGVPVLINYVIPGQEEGNAELLERMGCGCRSLLPGKTGALVAELHADGRLEGMRKCMEKHRNSEGAWTIAGAVLREVMPGKESAGDPH